MRVLGADKPIPKSSSKSDLDPDDVVLLPKDIEEELSGIHKKSAAEVKEKNDLQAVYASIIAQYDEYEEDDDEYISGAFSLERQSSADGPEIIEETTNNSVNVAIVRDMDGSKEVLVPNRNKLVKAPRSTADKLVEGGGVEGVVAVSILLVGPVVVVSILRIKEGKGFSCWS